MYAFASIVLPLFGALFIGYGVGRTLRLPAAGLAAIDFFVFYLAVPALFLRSAAHGRLHDMSAVSFLATTAFATYCAFAIAFSFGALINRGRVPEATILGLAGSYSNTLWMAPALTIPALGEAVGLPTALIFVVDHVLLAALVPLMMALGGTQQTEARTMARSIGRTIGRHPAVIATVLGVALGAVGQEPSGPVDVLLSTFANAAAPAALFALGAALALKPLSFEPTDVPVVVFVKLVIHPLIVYLLLSWIGGFDRRWVYAAMLVAALPPAVNVLSVARQYKVFADRAAGALLIGTAASIVTVSLAAALAIADDLPIDPFH
jgi:predicted permease